MCFQVNVKPSHRCIERELESSAKTRLPLRSIKSLILRRRSEHLSVFWYNLHSYYLPKGEKVVHERALMIPFLAIYANGGESMSPKQKDCTTTNFKNVVFQMWINKRFFNWYLIFYIISNWYTLFKINI